MKILLQVSTHSYKTYHFLAIRIREKYPKSEFALIGVNRIKQGIDFFNNQDDIQYTYFDDTLFNDDETKKVVNFDIINNFEKKSNSYIWKIVSSDRVMGGAFVHGSYDYGLKFQNNRSYILKKFEQKITDIENIFSKFQPNIFIPSIMMGNINVGIYEGMCKIYTTQYAAVTISRVKNYCSFSNNKMLNLNQIHSDTQDLIHYNLQPSKSSMELYNNLMSEIEDPDYFDSSKHISEINLVFIFKNLVLNPTISVIKSIIVCIKNNKYHNIWVVFLREMYRGVDNITVSRPNYGRKLPKSQKYLYYPLHISPEYSTLVQGGMLQDQLVIIELLAKSVPADWIIYVKEHPQTILSRLRPRDFFKKLKRIPNVEIAPIDSNMHNIISNSDMVATITGTSGLEAVLRGKPVVGFSDYINVFDGMDLSAKISDFNKLPDLISTEFDRIKLIPKNERARRVKLFLTAMLNNSFWVTHPKVLFYDEIGDDHEYEKCGVELAEGLIKFLPNIFSK